MKQSSNNRRTLRRSGPQPSRLEPRMMFDGAAIVDAAAMAAADPHPDRTVEAHVDPVTVEPVTVTIPQPEPPQPAPAATGPSETMIRAEEVAQKDAASQEQSAAADRDTLAGTADTEPATGFAAIDDRARDVIRDYLGQDGLTKLFAAFNGRQDAPSAEWTGRAEALQQRIASGDYGVAIRFVGADRMSGAYAAFAASGPDGSPTIFINSDWWRAQTDADLLTRTLVEEYGHSFDRALNPATDTRGDEGEAFSVAAMNLPVNGIDRARMAVEDDSAVLSIDGNSYAVERASYSFINAYRVYTGTGLLAEKEQNRDYFIDEPIGVTRITDMIPSTYFSGNDLVVQLTMGATNYYGWVSRPIKDQGIVRGFYFWYDPQFTTMSTATMDGNQDGDRNPGDNNAFILVVDQSYFNGIAASGTTTINGVARTYKFVGSSSDRVDSAINALIVPNRNPTPANDGLTVLEDGGPATGNLLTNDSDPDIDALSVTGFRVGGVSGTLGQPFAIAGVGQFTLSADGSYSFTPAADHAGPVPAITYTVSDGNGGSATATLSIAITPVNDAPAGTDRTIPLNEDSAYAFSATDFGFSDPKDSPAHGLASVVITTLPALGSLTLNGVAVTAGQEILAADIAKLRYTPVPDGFGSSYASFTFQVRDSGGTANGGINLDPTPNRITFNVANVNDAPAAAADTNQITEDTATVTGDVATNDSDPDGDGRTVIAVSGTGMTAGSGPFMVAGRYGTLTIQANGQYSYALDNGKAAVQALRQSGDTLTDSFSYTIADPGNLTATSTLVITIRGQNDAPAAANDSNVAKESIAGSGNYGVSDNTGFKATGNVLANDTDADRHGETKTVVGLVASATGTVAGGTTTTFNTTFGGNVNSLRNAGAQNVTAVQVEAVPGSGTYTTLVNGQGGNVTVLQFTGSGSSVGIILSDPSALAQYQIPQGGSLSIRLIASGNTYAGTYSSSTVTVTASTTASLTAATGAVAAGMTLAGTDADGVAFSTTVTGVQYANDGSVSQITLQQAQKLNGTPLTFTAAAGSTVTGRYGTLQLNADGSYTYTPTANNPTLNAGQSGIDSFRYQMRDAAGATAGATLGITVLGSGTNDPTAAADANSVTEAIAPSASGNVLTGAGTPLAGQADSTPLGTGSLTVTHARSVAGSETAVGSGTQIAGRYGTLTIGADGSYSYALNSADPEVDALRTSATTLSDLFAYRIANTAGGQSAATLTIVIRGSNDAPTIVFDTATAREAGGYGNATPGVNPTGNVLANDSDVDAGDILGVSLIEAGIGISGVALPVQTGTTAATGTGVAGFFGTLTIGADGSYVYVVDNANAAVQALGVGATLTERFTYMMHDAAGVSRAALLTIAIHGANDAPTSSPASASATVAEGASVSLPAITVADMDDATLTVQLSVQSGTLTILNPGSATIQSGTNGSAAVTLTGTASQLNAALLTLSYQGAAEFDGSDLLRVRTTDAGGLVAQSTVGITVSPDDRSLTVTGTTVNEASPYLVFRVDGAAGQKVTLALAATGAGNGHAAIGTDLLPNLEYFDGTAWTAYTGSPVAIPAGGALLVRSAVVGDGLYEGVETVDLVAANKAGRTFSGTGGIADDATGDIFLPGNTGFARDSSGAGYPAYLDDDRAVTVNNIAVNEASPYAVFTVSGQAGQVLRLSLVEGTARTPADVVPALQYFDGTNWVDYTAGSDLAMAGGSLLVRTAIVNDGIFEGQEAFALAVTRMSSGTTVYGTASIYDDGTGDVYLPGNRTGTRNTAGDIGYPAQLDDDRLLSVDSPVVNEASDHVVFTLTGNSGQTVTLSLINQTATIDTAQMLRIWDGLDWVDYDPNAALPTFDAAGRLYVRADIRQEQDTAYEGAETFLLRATLSGRATAAEGTATIRDDGTGVIHDMASGPYRTTSTGLDDDRSATVTQVGSPVTVTEGQSADYTVTLSRTTVRSETYALTLSGGTATFGTDFTDQVTFSNGVTYNAITGLVTVPAGVASFTMSVPTVDDPVKEPAEGFSLTIGGVAATGTILDNDAVSVSRVGDGAGTASSVTVTEGQAAVFTVRLSTSSSTAETYALALFGGTATQGSDFTDALTFSNGVTYDVATGLVTVPAGVTGFTVTVPTTDDHIREPAEAFTLTVGGATGTGTILDNDVVSVSRVGDAGGTTSGVTVTEGQAAVFAVALSGPSASADSYPLVLMDGTAALGADYTATLAFSNGVTYDATTGLVTVPAGVTDFTVTVPTLDDPVKEPTEGFSLSVGGVIATGTILDNDVVSVSRVGDAGGTTSGVMVTEGQAAVFTVSLSNPSSTAETYALALSGGTATQGSDFTDALTFSNGVTYDAATGRISVPAGVTRFTVTVPTTDDPIKEPTEAFSLAVGGTTGSGTILDNDAVSVSRVGDAGGTTSDIAVTEGQQAVITVALTTSSSTAESYPLTLTGVTATPGPDFATGLVFSNGVTYDAATGKVTVPAGVTRFTVAVATVDDALVEQAETVTLSVAGVTATIAIVDNDVIADRDVPRPPAVEQAPAPAAAPAAVPVEVSVPVVAPSVPSPGFAPLVEPALTPYSPFSDAVLPTRFDGLSGRGLQHELRVDKPLPDVLMPAGVQTLRYVLPTDTFIHTDRSARVELSAVMEDGSKLPGWLVFDAKKGEFSGTPPAGYKGDLMIRVVARDEAGRQAETMVRIRLSGQGERQAQLPGKDGLGAQLRSGGILAWKGERDRLVLQARGLALAKAAKSSGSVG